MKSRYASLQDQARSLRRAGKSIRYIEKILDIPRSTLSGWFKDIFLNPDQLHKLKQSQYAKLKKARTKASLWHNQQKLQRIRQAEEQATQVLNHINLKDKDIQQLALAILYLGEGFKADRELGIGNSDPLILKFFLHLYLRNFHAKIDSVRCELHLRSDQNPVEIKKYWSSELGIPLEHFTYIAFDKRTEGSKTYPSYKGVCALHFGNVAAKRKLLYIADEYCRKVLKGS